MTSDPNRHGSQNQASSEYELLPRAASPPAPAAELSKRSESISQGWATLVLDTWFWEALAMVFSVLCFAAIICILGVFEGKARPHFAYGLTLNAIASVLATASKSSLIYVIGECIGQLKWIWFYKKRRRLDQIQLFDSASRGPLGSLFMLMQHMGRSLVSLGALVTILALTFDPFVQQILTYPTREAVESSGTGRAVAKQAFAFLPDTFDAHMQTIINTGVWSQSSDYLQPNLTCSSGNCKWPAFQSVGMCSRCEDITSQTRFNCTPPGFNDTTMSEESPAVITCEIVPPQGKPAPITVGLKTSYIPNSTLPTLFTLNFTEFNVWSTFGYDKGSTDFGAIYAGIRDPQFVIAQAEVALVSNQTAASPLADLGRAFHIKNAKQCAVGLCARTYNVSVSNGTASFNVSAPDYGERFVNPQSAVDSVPIDMTAFWPTCWKPSQGTPANRINVIKVDGGWANVDEFATCDTGDFSYVDQYFAGSTKIQHSLSQYDAGNFSRWASADGRSFETPEPSVARILSKGLEPVIRDVAASFTKTGLTASNFTADNGTVLVSEVYVSVDWVWLVLPGALVLLSIVFLVLTVATNRQQRLFLWKSSILAVLFHGLAGGEGEGGLKDTAVEMEQTAQDIRVRLRMVDQRRGLVLD